MPGSELVLVPGGTVITSTPDESRALAFKRARRSIHNIRLDLDILKADRSLYSANTDSVISASQGAVIEFQTIAAANNYCRQRSIAATLGGVDLNR